MNVIPHTELQLYYHDAHIVRFDFGKRNELNIYIYCNKEFNHTTKDGEVLLSFRAIENINNVREFMLKYFESDAQHIGMRVDFINYQKEKRYLIKFDYTDELLIICKGVTENEIG